jgi:hypothetical protein
MVSRELLARGFRSFLVLRLDPLQVPHGKEHPLVVLHGALPLNVITQRLKDLELLRLSILPRKLD